jgi:hypothetical protein
MAETADGSGDGCSEKKTRDKKRGWAGAGDGTGARCVVGAPGDGQGGSEKGVEVPRGLGLASHVHFCGTPRTATGDFFSAATPRRAYGAGGSQGAPTVVGPSRNVQAARAWSESDAHSRVDGDACVTCHGTGGFMDVACVDCLGDGAAPPAGLRKTGEKKGAPRRRGRRIPSPAIAGSAEEPVWPTRSCRSTAIWPPSASPGTTRARLAVSAAEAETVTRGLFGSADRPSKHVRAGSDLAPSRRR